jgi:hypothetical protein
MANIQAIKKPGAWPGWRLFKGMPVYPAFVEGVVEYVEQWRR